MDEETRQMILKKTWCHGQVLAPALGLVCLVWFAHRPSFGLLYAGIVLPAWCYVSYRNVFGSIHPWQLVAGGVAVEIAYLAILVLSIPGAKDKSDPSRNWYTLLSVASGLLAFETLAFLAVALTLHATAPPSSYGGRVTSAADYRNLPSLTTTTATTSTPIRGSLA
jgi:hypothetical protein